MTVQPLATYVSRHCRAWEMSARLPAVSPRCTGQPPPSQTRCSFEFSPPLVLPMLRPSPLFFHAIGGDPMRFDVAGVNHQHRQISRLARQSIEDTFENACFGPTFPAVIECLGRAIFGRNIRPAIASLNAEYDARKNLAIIYSRNTARFVWQ